MLLVYVLEFGDLDTTAFDHVLGANLGSCDNSFPSNHLPPRDYLRNTAVSPGGNQVGNVADDEFASCVVCEANGYFGQVCVQGGESGSLVRYFTKLADP